VAASLSAIRAALIPTLFVAIGPAALAAGGEPFFASGSYVISLRGINIAEAEIGFSDEGDTYRVAINGQFSGVATIITSGSATMSSSGRVRAAGLVSDSFALTTQTENDFFSFGFQAAGGTVTSETVYPPLPEGLDRVPIRRSHRLGVNDPIAAFVVKADSLGPAVCERTLKVYTGIERYDMELSFLANQQATSQRTGYQGPVVLCAIRYKPIAGHFVGSESTEYLAQTDRFLIWYAPLGHTGFLIPYRMLMGTAFGDLSMVLVAMDGV